MHQNMFVQFDFFYFSVIDGNKVSMLVFAKLLIS